MTAARIGLFSGPAPRILAAPASAPFLDLLAEALVSELAGGEDAFALSDALILLPNRRSARGLIDAFAERLGGAALLPTIRPLGDPYADDDPDVWGADPVGLDILPPIDKLQRRLQLASLIRRRDKAQSGVEDPARAIALADELAKLLDSAATADSVAWEKLPALVEEKDLARHWASSAEFLQIVATYWPLHLKEQGLSDFAAHGAALRRALAERWRAEPPTRPIVIAGSTGSIATTRELMRVVAGLPRGAVVLPGLDIDLDEDSWDVLSDQHPQHALKETLVALGVTRDEIPLLCSEASEGRARRLLMREALAPAEKTADWLARLDAAGGANFVAAGAQGLRLLEAATEDEEATAIALMLREALENETSVALVTPDVNLSRRVESKLARWNISPQISHGRPLGETEAGALLALLCKLARDPAEPVALAGLLKHPRVLLARDTAGRATLEHKGLRGPRCHQTLDDLAARLSQFERAQRIVLRTNEALTPLIAAMATNDLTLADFAEAIATAMENVAGADVWAGADGERVADLVRDAITHGNELGAMQPAAAPRTFLRLMQGREVPPPTGGEARIAIWGLLEARLQRRDLMILGGLNEGVWPAPPAEDPFLSRPMRAALGLPSVDARIGLAAHDFAQLANAPNVVLTRSVRREGSPTLASRWLWRLQTLVQGADAKLASASKYVEWARCLHEPSAPRPLRIPRPRPPAGKRLTRLSVTQVETLIRDPYAVYARRILGIEVLRPIGYVASYAERGSAVHKAIERFEDGHDHALLGDLLDEELMNRGIPPERRAAERARLKTSINALIDWFAERKKLGATIYREAAGLLDINEVKLSCIADRIEIGPNHVAILDFKTGSPATVKQVQSGLSPQLPLEAAMLARGAFENVPAAIASELSYWRFGNAEPTPKPLDVNAMEEAEKALKALEALLARYAEPEQAFLSKPRVQFIKPYDDYDHLARRKEWADAEADE